MVILRERRVALFLGGECARGELFAALVGFRLVIVARRRFLPGVDLFRHRVLDGEIGDSRQIDLARLRSRRQRCHADGLGLEEGPEIRRFHVVADSRGLRAFSERFGEGQKQRDDRDQERDLFVTARNMLEMFGVLDFFMR